MAKKLIQMLNQFLRRIYLTSRTRGKKSKQNFKNNKKQTHFSLRKPKYICIYVLNMKHPFKKSQKLFASLYLPKKIWKYTGDFSVGTMTGVWQDTQWPGPKMENAMQCARTIPQNKELSQPNANRALLVEKQLFLTRTTYQIQFFLAMPQGLRDLSSLTRDLTWALGTESAEP